MTTEQYVEMINDPASENPDQLQVGDEVYAYCGIWTVLAIEDGIVTIRHDYVNVSKGKRRRTPKGQTTTYPLYFIERWGDTNDWTILPRQKDGKLHRADGSIVEETYEYKLQTTGVWIKKS
jgi:hypothetical protein